MEEISGLWRFSLTPRGFPVVAVALIGSRRTRVAAKPVLTDCKHWRSVAEGALTRPPPPVVQFCAPCAAAAALPDRVGPRHFVRAVPDWCAACPFGARRTRLVRAVPVSANCRFWNVDGVRMTFIVMEWFLPRLWFRSLPSPASCESLDERLFPPSIPRRLVDVLVLFACHSP